MYISQELASNREFDFSDQLYQLLASVTANVDHAMILDCLSEATNINAEDLDDLDVKTIGMVPPKINFIFDQAMIHSFAFLGWLLRSLF